MRSEIYIEGKPYEGIGELEPVEPDNLPRIVKLPEPAELTLTLPPEANAELAEVLRKAAEQASDFWAHIVDFAIPALQRLAAVLKEALPFYVGEDLREINPRWFHMYRHHKKARIRNKYRNRLLRERRKRERVA